MKVKVLLTADVKGIGKKGDVVEVSRGYASNYLIPKKLGILATEDVVNTYKAKQQAQERKIEKERKTAKEVAAMLEGKKLVVRKKVGESGKLFGSITPKELAELINSNFKVSVDKKEIEISNPIKSVGEFEVNVNTGFGFSATITVVVEPE